jgi:hypothetical protein
MSQVVKTVNELITNSLYLLGELGTNETPDSFMLSTGLELINEILAMYDSDSIFIPYITTVSFDMVVGQRTYSLSDMVPADVITNRVVDLSYANYTVPSAGQGIIYPLQIINKAQYYGVTRLTPLNTRPGFIFLDKQAEESFITLYPSPDQPYPCQLGVKSMLDSVIANGNLGQMPPFYYGLLKFTLSRRFLAYYPSGNWPQQNEDTYQEYMNIIKNANETDLTIRPSAILSRAEPFYWQNILAY